MGTKSGMMMNGTPLANGCTLWDVATAQPRGIGDDTVSYHVPSPAPCFGKVKVSFMFKGSRLKPASGLKVKVKASFRFKGQG